MHLFIHQNALCQFWGEIKLNLMLVANSSGVRVEEGGGGGGNGVVCKQSLSGPMSGTS